MSQAALVSHLIHSPLSHELLGTIIIVSLSSLASSTRRRPCVTLASPQLAREPDRRGRQPRLFPLNSGKESFSRYVCHIIRKLLQKKCAPLLDKPSDPSSSFSLLTPCAVKNSGQPHRQEIHGKVSRLLRNWTECN